MGDKTGLCVPLFLGHCHPLHLLSSTFAQLRSQASGWTNFTLSGNQVWWGNSAARKQVQSWLAAEFLPAVWYGHACAVCTHHPPAPFTLTRHEEGSPPGEAAIKPKLKHNPYLAFWTIWHCVSGHVVIFCSKNLRYYCRAIIIWLALLLIYLCMVSDFMKHKTINGI